MNNIIDIYESGKYINIDEQFKKLNFQKHTFSLNDKIVQIHYKGLDETLIVFDLENEKLKIYGNNISMELLFLIFLKLKETFKELKEERIQRILEKWLKSRGDEE